MHFKNQKYASIKKALLKKGDLFTDPEFEPTSKSVYYSKIDNEIEWKRPKELCKVPKLFVEGASCDDLSCGECGNEWFISACSGLSQIPALWRKVVPDVKEQEWSEELKYAGIFHFQFWRYGQWIDVVIDDNLPTKDGKLLFCQPRTRNEFWGPLVEKAYAKLYGDYEILRNRSAIDAIVDFTGGVSEKLILEELDLSSSSVKSRLFRQLLQATENNAIITCYIKCSDEEKGSPANNDLINGRVYGIPDIKEVTLNKVLKGAIGASKLLLGRLRTPRGTDVWSGAWSEGSTEWKSLSAKDKQSMGLKYEQEGESWMSFEDIVNNFTHIDVCHFFNTSMFTMKKTWQEAVLKGEWTQGATMSEKDRSGGCEEHKTFLFNPQFVFDVPGESDTMMFSLEQDDTHMKKERDEDHRCIGVHIMKVEENREYRVHIAGIKMDATAYRTSRSIYCRADLPKGRYVIIPSTKDPGAVGRFMLRMFTTDRAQARELTADEPKKGLPCIKSHVLVTRINVIKAVDLPEPPKKGNTMDSYVVVKGEGGTVKSSWITNSLNPEWDFKVIFYRKKPGQKLITIEVYNHNMIKDEFLGIATIDIEGTTTPEVKEFKLFGKGKKEKDIERPGILHVEIASSDDLTDL